MDIAIVGSRDYPNLEQVSEYVRSLPDDTIIISGGARGVDTIAATAAKRRGLKVVIYKPDWSQHGKAAGMIRNAYIVHQADKVVAFWDGKSKGTLDTITRAVKARKLKIVVTPNDNDIIEQTRMF